MLMGRQKKPGTTYHDLISLEAEKLAETFMVDKTGRENLLRLFLTCLSCKRKSKLITVTTL